MRRYQKHVDVLGVFFEGGRNDGLYKRCVLGVVAIVVAIVVAGVVAIEEKFIVAFSA